MKKSLRKQIIAKAPKPPKARPVRERDIEVKVVAYAKQKGCLVYKFSSPSHRGVCDRVIIAPGGAVLFLELKRPKEKPTKLQQKFLDDVAEQGGISRWADNVDDAQRHVDIIIQEGLWAKKMVVRMVAITKPVEASSPELDATEMALLG